MDETRKLLADKEYTGYDFGFQTAGRTGWSEGKDNLFCVVFAASQEAGEVVPRGFSVRFNGDKVVGVDLS